MHRIPRIMTSKQTSVNSARRSCLDKDGRKWVITDVNPFTQTATLTEQSTSGFPGMLYIGQVREIEGRVERHGKGTTFYPNQEQFNGEYVNNEAVNGTLTLGRGKVCFPEMENETGKSNSKCTYTCNTSKGIITITGLYNNPKSIFSSSEPIEVTIEFLDTKTKLTLQGLYSGKLVSPIKNATRIIISVNDEVKIELFNCKLKKNQLIGLCKAELKSAGEITELELFNPGGIFEKVVICQDTRTDQVNQILLLNTAEEKLRLVPQAKMAEFNLGCAYYYGQHNYMQNTQNTHKKYIEEILRENPDHPYALLEKALLYAKEQVTDILEKALKIMYHPDILFALGKHWYRLADLEKAQYYFLAAAKMNHPDALFYVGSYYNNAKTKQYNPTKAFLCFQHAMLMLNNLHVYSNIAQEIYKDVNIINFIREVLAEEYDSLPNKSKFPTEDPITLEEFKPGDKVVRTSRYPKEDLYLIENIITLLSLSTPLDLMTRRPVVFTNLPNVSSLDRIRNKNLNESLIVENIHEDEFSEFFKRAFYVSMPLLLFVNTMNYYLHNDHELRLIRNTFYLTLSITCMLTFPIAFGFARSPLAKFERGLSQGILTVCSMYFFALYKVMLANNGTNNDLFKEKFFVIPHFNVLALMIGLAAQICYNGFLRN